MSSVTSIEIALIERIYVFISASLKTNSNSAFASECSNVPCPRSTFLNEDVK